MFDIITYFATLAEQLPELNVQTGKTNFFKVQNSRNLLFNSDFLGQLAKAHSPCLIIEFSREGNFGGTNNDNRNRNYTGAFYILYRVAPTDESGKQSANDNADLLIQKIASRIDNDKRTNIVPRTLGIDFSIVNIGPIADYWIGLGAIFAYWECANLTYDPEEWNIPN